MPPIKTRGRGGSGGGGGGPRRGLPRPSGVSAAGDEGVDETATYEYTIRFEIIILNLLDY
jgi:hypothetical protein